MCRLERFVTFSLVMLLAIGGCGGLPLPAATPASAPPSPVLALPTATPVLLATPASASPSPAVALPTTTPVPPAAPTAGQRDTLILALEAEPDTLFPGMMSTMWVSRIVNEMIFAFAVKQSDSMAWLPIGVESVPTLENGGARFVGQGADRHLDVTCTIKKGLLWHDGVAVTARDAVFQWELYMQPDVLIADRGLMVKVFNVKAADERTVVYQFLSEKQAVEAAAGALASENPKVSFAALKEAYAGFSEQSGPVVDALYFTVCGWLPSHLLTGIPAKDQGDPFKNPWARLPVGDGAYILKSWKPGDRMELAANPHFIMGEPKIKNVTLVFNGNKAGTVASLLNGDVVEVSGLYTCAAIPRAANSYRGQNFAGWCNRDADALLEQAGQPDLLVSRVRSQPLYAEVQRLWTGDAPVIPLFRPASIVAANATLKNWKPGPSRRSTETWNCWEWAW